MKVQTVETDHFSMRYAVFGDGARPFVILPGVSLHRLTESAAAVAVGFSEFAAEYTVYLFDRKENMEDGYSVVDMARDTAEAMQRLGIRAADIYGASQGGMIAQVLAARYPALVGKVVLASTLCGENDVSRETFAAWRRLAESGDVRALNRSVFEKVYSAAYREKYRGAFAKLESLGTAEEMRRFAVMVAACADFDGAALLSAIRAPVLVMGSRQDEVIGADATARLAARLGCQSYVYDGYSHAVYDEAPDFRERMLAFFRA